MCCSWLPLIHFDDFLAAKQKAAAITHEPFVFRVWNVHLRSDGFRRPAVEKSQAMPDFVRNRAIRLTAARKGSADLFLRTKDQDKNRSERGGEEGADGPAELGSAWFIARTRLLCGRSGDLWRGGRLAGGGGDGFR